MEKEKHKEIEDLINLHQEGEYWDFKREWYKDNYEGDMLHDIICMANNLADRDAYIIIGIDDNNNFEPYSFDRSKRRNTQQLVDFLRDKKFAGSVRPDISVDRVEIQNNEIDIITIHNSINTPFYLEKSYHEVRAYYIYTRVRDTNTPKDRSADIDIVENLWKKRFGLFKSSVERFSIYLKQKSDWENCSYYESAKYYKYSPEFTIEYVAEDPNIYSGYEYYLLTQIDITPHWYIIRLKYNQTVIYELQGLALDGGRLFTSVPDRDGFSISEGGGWEVSYSYYVKNSLGYIIHEFYLSDNWEAKIACNSFMELVLLFDSEEERLNFIPYVKKHWNSKKSFKYNKAIHYPKAGYSDDAFKAEVENAIFMNSLLLQFRRENKSNSVFDISIIKDI